MRARERLKWDGGGVRYNGCNCLMQGDSACELELDVKNNNNKQTPF